MSEMVLHKDSDPNARSLTLRSTTLLNQTGHVTFVWDEESDHLVLPVIQAKMDEGISFFIVKAGFTGNKIAKTPVVEIGEVIDKATEQRAIAVQDEDFGKLVIAGAVQVIKNDDNITDTKTVRRAKSAKEVVGSTTVAVRRAGGG